MAKHLEKFINGTKVDLDSQTWKNLIKLFDEVAYGFNKTDIKKKEEVEEEIMDIIFG